MPRLLTWFVEHREVENWVASGAQVVRSLSVVEDMRRDATDAAAGGYPVVLARGNKDAKRKVTTFAAAGSKVTSVTVAEHRLIKAPSQGSSRYDASITWKITRLIDPFA